MIGALTIMVSVITVSIWTCWTSLVVRVIRLGVPNWPTSRALKACTRWKRAERTSRPSAAAVRAPKKTAAAWQTTWTRLMPSMSAPTRMM